MMRVDDIAKKKTFAISNQFAVVILKSESGYYTWSFGTFDFAAFLWSNFYSKHSLLVNMKKAITLNINE